jgi:hypothetical protein
MPNTFAIQLDGQTMDDNFYDQLISLEVEENADLPGAVQLTLPVNASNGDITFVNDTLKPFTNIAVVITPDSGSAECIFDGYVLTQRLHMERGVVASKLEVWGQDASWLMNLEEKVQEFADMTDSQVAEQIFGSYGITPAPQNSSDDSPSHTEDGSTLMQRDTDIAFLRRLAQSTGKLCRVVSTNTPGERTGYFARPRVDGHPVVTLDVNDPEAWNVGALDFQWDASRPTRVSAKQVFLNDADGGIDISDCGLSLLDERGLSDFAGQTTSVLLTAPADSADELTLRAQALLEDASWFARCEGESDLARLKMVLRVGTVVGVQGVGSVHSGNYLVWSVRHTITAESHKMRFVLVRNAVGPQGTGDSSLAV